MPLPDSHTCAMTCTRPRTCFTANSSSLLRSSSPRLTDSPACMGIASESAPLRRWNSMIFPYKSKSTRYSRVNGVTGVWTRPASKMAIFSKSRQPSAVSRQAQLVCRLGLASGGSPTVRLGLQDAHLFELAADVGLPLRRGGRQRLAGRAHRPAHHHHAALERRRVLVAEEEP